MDNIPITPHFAGGTTPKEAETSTQSSLQEKAHEARERITAKARETKARVRDQGEHMMRDQKKRVADRIGQYGSAVHRAAHNLEDEEDATIAYYAHRAADQLDHAAEYLRERDWPQLRRDAEGLARRHQDLFMGGLFLGGFVLARLLKASHHEDWGSAPASSRRHYRGTSAELEATEHTSTTADQPSPSI
jgi:hypothetical protein